MPDRDLIVIGAGSAGLSAAQYGARSALDTLVIEEMASGGQALIIDKLENYPGLPPIGGYEFSQAMHEQAERFGADFLTASVNKITKENSLLMVDTTEGILSAYTVIIATGSKHRKLDIPGEKQFAGHGVSYCATCDGPFFKGKKVIVVGGGDAACDEAMYLSKLAEKVIMVHRKDRFRAQKTLANRVLENSGIEVRFNHIVKEIHGTSKVESVLLENTLDLKHSEEQTSAVFIFIGSEPRSGLIQNIDKNENGYIITDENMQTSLPGLFAAGDVRLTPFRQIVTAAADGAIAARYASHYIDGLHHREYR